MSDPQATLLDQQCSGASAGERVCWSFKSRVSGVGGGEERGESGDQAGVRRKRKAWGSGGGKGGGARQGFFLLLNNIIFKNVKSNYFQEYEED